MGNDQSGTDDDRIDNLLTEVVKRSDALRRMGREPLTKGEMQEELDVSKTTVHRITKSLTERNLIRETNEGYTVTGLGSSVSGEVFDLQESVSRAQNLEMFLNEAEERGFEIDLGAFDDMNVTFTEPGHPYQPVERFMELIEDTETLKGLDTTTLAPIYVDKVHKRILEGLEVEVVYEPHIVESVASNYPEKMTEVIETGRLDVWVHDDLPFGLAVFDDRIGLGGYDDESGMLRVFIDTDSEEAIEWAEKVFESYKKKAEKVEL